MYCQRCGRWLQVEAGLEHTPGFSQISCCTEKELRLLALQSHHQGLLTPKGWGVLEIVLLTAAGRPFPFSFSVFSFYLLSQSLPFFPSSDFDFQLLCCAAKAVSSIERTLERLFMDFSINPYYICVQVCVCVVSERERQKNKERERYYGGCVTVPSVCKCLQTLVNFDQTLGPSFFSLHTLPPPPPPTLSCFTVHCVWQLL